MPGTAWLLGLSEERGVAGPWLPIKSGPAKEPAGDSWHRGEGGAGGGALSLPPGSTGGGGGEGMARAPVGGGGGGGGCFLHLEVVGVVVVAVS